MGADLYIEKMDRDQQHTGFRRAVDLGYFRDAYNNSNILWQFDLSYWTDISKRFANHESLMDPTNTKRLLKLLEKREVVFEENLKGMLEKTNRVWDFEEDIKTGRKTHKPAKLTAKQRKEWAEFYRKGHKELKTFLQKAIDMKSNIICSC